MHWIFRAARGRGPLLPDVVEAWLARQILDPETFAALADELKAKAFTVKGDAWAALLKDAHNAIFDAIADGNTVSEFVKDLWPKVAQKHGAYGAEVAAHMETIFRTNVQAAFAGGRYAAMFRPDMVELYPFVRYRAILDTRVRPEHRELHGKVFRKDDPYARRYFPPLGFNCRCVLEELDEEDVRGGGWSVTPGHTLYTDPAIGPPPKGWDTDRVSALVGDTFRARFLGPPDPEVTERIVRRYEEDLRKVKSHEEAIAFDQYGLVTWRGIGKTATPSQVEIPPGVNVAKAIVTHNHVKMNPPSVGDLAVLAIRGADEIRVVGGEWLWRLRPISGVWPSEAAMNAVIPELYRQAVVRAEAIGSIRALDEMWLAIAHRLDLHYLVEALP